MPVGAIKGAITRRLKRIGIASQSVGDRIFLTASLVLPKITWAGAWMRPTKKQIASWENAIELAVCGRRFTGRSRFLIWATHIGGSLNPTLRLGQQALRHEKIRWMWFDRQTMLGRAHPRPRHASPRLQETLASWGWEYLEDGQVSTHLGILDLRWDSWTVAKQLAMGAWEGNLWRTDPRSEGAIRRLDGAKGICLLPVLTYHRQWAKGSYWHQRVAVGAGADGNARGAVLGNLAMCKCGEPMPSRQHLTWRCSARGHSDIREPAHKSEEKLLVPAGVVMVKSPRVMDSSSSRMRAGLRSARKIKGWVVGASDGGSEGRILFHRVGSWGVAILGGGSYGGPLRGLDSTPGMAEKWGLLQALMAATDEKVQICLFVDNLNCVRAARRVLQDLPPASHDFVAWHKELCALRARGLVFQVHWVPSHGKYVDEWFPTADMDFAQHARRLNALADSAATQAMEWVWKQGEPERAQWRSMELWEEEALTLQSRVIWDYRTQLDGAEAAGWMRDGGGYLERGLTCRVWKNRDSILEEDKAGSIGMRHRDRLLRGPPFGDLLLSAGYNQGGA